MAYTTTHELAFDTDNMDPTVVYWSSKNTTDFCRRLFGYPSSVIIKFTAEWDKFPAEREAGYPLPYFEVADVDIESVTYYMEPGEEIEITEKNCTKDDWEFIAQICMDAAAESGEDPEDENDFYADSDWDLRCGGAD